jgi:hypothetical protein
VRSAEPDGKIEHYQRMSARITDQPTLDGIKKLIERVKAKKAASPRTSSVNRFCGLVGVPTGAFGVVHLSNPADSKRNRARSPSIWAVSREVSKPVISGVSPS